MGWIGSMNVIPMKVIIFFYFKKQKKSFHQNNSEIPVRHLCLFVFSCLNTPLAWWWWRFWSLKVWGEREREIMIKNLQKCHSFFFYLLIKFWSKQTKQNKRWWENKSVQWLSTNKKKFLSFFFKNLFVSCC